MAASESGEAAVAPVSAEEKDQLCVRLAHERSLGVGPDIEVCV
jgi:hypothetical protein